MGNDINLADYTEIKNIGNVRQGDILVFLADAVGIETLTVEKVTRTCRTITILARNLDNQFLRHHGTKHRASTPVDKIYGGNLSVLRKITPET